MSRYFLELAYATTTRFVGCARGRYRALTGSCKTFLWSGLLSWASAAVPDFPGKVYLQLGLSIALIASIKRCLKHPG